MTTVSFTTFNLILDCVNSGTVMPFFSSVFDVSSFCHIHFAMSIRKSEGHLIIADNSI